MHFLYILLSPSLDKYYVGETSDPKHRLYQHNNHQFKKGFTKAAEDWAIVLQRKCSDKQEALYLERFIKRMKNRKFTKKVINNPKILEDLLSKR